MIYRIAVVVIYINVAMVIMMVITVNNILTTFDSSVIHVLYQSHPWAIIIAAVVYHTVGSNVFLRVKMLSILS